MGQIHSGVFNILRFINVYLIRVHNLGLYIVLKEIYMDREVLTFCRPFLLKLITSLEFYFISVHVNVKKQK